MGIKQRRRYSPWLLGLLLLLPGCAVAPSRELASVPHVPPAAGTPRKQPGEALAVARELDAKGREAEAASHYERARQEDPTLALEHRLAVLYDRQGQDDRAQAEYRKALEREPNNASLHNDFGYFHYQRGRYNEAEKWLRKATELDAPSGRAWVNLGLALAHQGRDAESLQAFGKALPPAEAKYNLGVVQAKLGRHDEARLTLEHALRLNPELRNGQALVAAIDAGGPIRPASGSKVTNPEHPE